MLWSCALSLSLKLIVALEEGLTVSNSKFQSSDAPSSANCDEASGCRSLYWLLWCGGKFGFASLQMFKLNLSFTDEMKGLRRCVTESWELWAVRESDKRTTPNSQQQSTVYGPRYERYEHGKNKNCVILRSRRCSCSISIVASKPFIGSDISVCHLWRNCSIYF